MEATPRGFRSYYGPTPGLDDGQLIIFVTNRGRYTAGNHHWPPDEAIDQHEANIRAAMPDYNRSDAWDVLYDLIAEAKTPTDMTPVLRTWLLLLGVSGKARCIQEAKRLTAAGYLPAIWVITARDEAQQRSGGMSGMLALPPAYVPYDSNSPRNRSHTMT
jgi:hypothetical protein